MMTWQPLSTIPPHIRDGHPFLARWKAGDYEPYKWEWAVAYYGQFGNCFFWSPIGYCAGKRVFMNEGEGISGSGMGIGEPEIYPEEWCEIPE